MVVTLEHVSPKTSGYENVDLLSDEGHVFYGILGVIREIFRIPATWANLSLAHVELDEETFDGRDISYLRVLTPTEKGSRDRRMACDTAVICIRDWLKGAEVGLVTEWPDQHKRPDSRIKNTRPDQINTTFWVEQKNRGLTVIVVPSVDSLDENRYLDRQKKLGREVVVTR